MALIKGEDRDTSAMPHYAYPCPFCEEEVEYYWEQCPNCTLVLQQTASADCVGCDRIGIFVSNKTQVSATRCEFHPVPEKDVDWVRMPCTRKVKRNWKICPDCKQSLQGPLSKKGIQSMRNYSDTQLKKVWLEKEPVKRMCPRPVKRIQRKCASHVPLALECPTCTRRKAPPKYFCSHLCWLRFRDSWEKKQALVEDGTDSSLVPFEHHEILEGKASRDSTSKKGLTLFLNFPFQAYEVQRPTPSVLAQYQKQYQQNGHLLARQILSASLVSAVYPYFLSALRKRLAMAVDDMDEEDEEGEEDILETKSEKSSKAFIRTYNMWRENKILKDFICHPVLFQTAAALLQVKQVCIYQDSIFLKEPGDSVSPWHQDMAACPLHTDRFVTAWIPFTPISKAHGSLQFASKSHLVDFRVCGHRPANDGTRKLYEPKKYRPIQVEKLKACGFTITPPNEMECGDVTFHSGWTFHAAPPNHATSSRPALAISFCDADATFYQDLRLEIVDDLPTLGNLNATSVLQPGGSIATSDHPLFTLSPDDA